MTTSATTTREVKRQRTLHRISRCAQRLTAEHGLDGYTMEDLAEAADVSRRTLFNYYPSKMDAVLGPLPDLGPDVTATFTSGGPHGDLFADLGELAAVLLEDHEVDRESVRLSHQLATRDPRVLAASTERFQEVTNGFVDLVLVREGSDFGVDRARLLLELVVTVFEHSMVVFAEEAEGDRDLFQVFTQQLRTARELFA